MHTEVHTPEQKKTRNRYLFHEFYGSCTRKLWIAKEETMSFFQQRLSPSSRHCELGLVPYPCTPLLYLPLFSRPSPAVRQASLWVWPGRVSLEKKKAEDARGDVEWTDQKEKVLCEEDRGTNISMEPVLYKTDPRTVLRKDLERERDLRRQKDKVRWRGPESI